MSLKTTFQNAMRSFLPPVPEPVRPEPGPGHARIYNLGQVRTTAKKRVDEDSAKRIATAYRCANQISNDIATIPLQVFRKMRMGAARVPPDAATRNLAYLLEVQPNRWMVPLVWKRTIANWLIWWGNAYVWAPLVDSRELFILDASRTYPVFDASGDKHYVTAFPDGSRGILPGVEVAHLMLNSKDGLGGHSVLEYARETFGRQLAAHETQDSISGDGLRPTAALYVDTKGKELSEASRDQLRKTYLDAVGTGVAVFPNIITKYEPITMKATDAQFLEGISATDGDIANFFDMPLHKVNMGKQSYESNDQQELNYLKACLNPYLVQVEQVGRLSWISLEEQADAYLRFERNAILQTDAEKRERVLNSKILNGQLTPNDALAIEDMTGYDGGDQHYIPANMIPVSKAGGMAPAVPQKGGQNA